jgi:hypothetical protein
MWSNIFPSGHPTRLRCKKTDSGIPESERNWHDRVWDTRPWSVTARQSFFKLYPCILTKFKWIITILTRNQRFSTLLFLISYCCWSIFVVVVVTFGVVVVVGGSAVVVVVFDVNKSRIGANIYSHQTKQKPTLFFNKLMAFCEQTVKALRISTIFCILFFHSSISSSFVST